MTQHDHEAVLELARQSLAPGDADRTRVLSALEERLALPPSESRNELARSRELHSMSAPSLPLGPRTWLRKALGAVVPLGGVAAVAVLLTMRHPAPKTFVREPATQAAADLTERSLLELTITHGNGVSEPKAAAPEPVTPAKEKKPPRKRCRGEPCASASTKPVEPVPVSPPPPPAVAPSPLSQELAALREAQRALREGQPAHALAVLNDFEQAHEGAGSMQEERHAAATMARCALAQHTDAKPLYDAFVQRYPNSAYAARLQHVCLTKALR